MSFSAGDQNQLIHLYKNSHITSSISHFINQILTLKWIKKYIIVFHRAEYIIVFRPLVIDIQQPNNVNLLTFVLGFINYWRVDLFIFLLTLSTKTSVASFFLFLSNAMVASAFLALKIMHSPFP